MKKLFALLLVMLITVNVYAVELSLTIDKDLMILNGEHKIIKAPVEQNGMTLVPVRVVTEAFGADVLWQDIDQSVTITKGDKKLWLQIGNINAILNGENIQLLTEPKLLDDTTMVPIRLVSEMLDCDVSYDDNTREIFIKDKDQFLWTMDVPEEFLIDNKAENRTVYYNEDLTKIITVATYKKMPGDTIEASAEKAGEEIKLMHKWPSKIGFRIENGLRKGVVSFENPNTGVSGKYIVFFAENIKYIIDIYAKNTDVTELEKIVDTLKVQNTSVQLPSEYEEGRNITYDINDNKFELATGWDKTVVNDITTVFKNDGYGLEISLDCFNFKTMNNRQILEPYGLFTVTTKAINEFEALANMIYEKRDGLPYRIKTNRNSIGFAGVSDYVYYYSPCEVTRDFYGSEPAFIFDMHDGSVEFKEEAKDKYKKDFKDFTIFDKKFDKIVKDRICYVFCVNNSIMVAECKIINGFTYNHNKFLYDNIVKTALKIND